jgi:hypothetical protein
MRTGQAKEVAGVALRASGERSQGLLPSVLRFVGGRVAAMQVDNMAQLPVVPNRLGPIQDPGTGLFYFLIGYSVPGGGDVFG